MIAKSRIGFGICILAIFIVHPANQPSAYAETGDCVSSPCIDVMTDPRTGEIVGLGTSVSPGRAGRRTTVIKRPVTKKKPTSSASANPLCTVEQLMAFTCIKTSEPVVPKPAAPHATSVPPKPTLISTDEVRRSLPLAQPGFQPPTGAVVNMPVIFWSGLVTPAQFSLTLLGHSVEINMTARCQWSWGDGTSLVTASVGAPYPNQSITHTYAKPGRYLVSVLTTWSGTAMLNRSAIQIVGAPIESTGRIEVVIDQAPTMLTSAE